MSLPAFGQLMRGEFFGRSAGGRGWHSVQNCGGRYQIVGTGGVVNQEGLAAAMADVEVVETIVNAFGSRTKLPALEGGGEGLGDEDAMAPALLDFELMKGISPAGAHKDSHVVVGQTRVFDDIVIEIEVEGNAGRQVVVQEQARETAVFGEVTGQPVELIVERHEIIDDKAPGAGSSNETPRAAMATGHVFDSGVRHVPHVDAIIVEHRTVGGRVPQFDILMTPVAVDGQVRQV